MAEQQIVAELLLERHLAKYAAKCLDPTTQGLTKYGPELSRALAEQCGFQLEISPSSAVHRGKLLLSLSRRAWPELDPSTHKKAVLLVQKFWHAEFVRTVEDQLAFMLPRKEAIQLARRFFGIDDDDLDFRSSERAFQRYQEQKYHNQLQDSLLSGTLPPPKKRRGRPSRSAQLRLDKRR